MATLIIKWLITAGAVFLAGKYLPGISVLDFKVALWVALAFGLANLIVRPILTLITLPINILSLGLFTFAINGFLFWAIKYVVPGFAVDSFLHAIIGAFAVTLASSVVERVLMGRDRKLGGN